MTVARLNGPSRVMFACLLFACLVFAYSGTSAMSREYISVVTESARGAIGVHAARSLGGMRASSLIEPRVPPLRQRKCESLVWSASKV